MNGPAIDVSRFSPHNNGASAPLWWGFLGLILVEGSVFATLVSSYMYLRLVAIEWPPAGVKAPDLLLPSINTMLLLASSACVYLADTGIRKGNQRRLRRGLGLAIPLALAFLIIKVVEYSSVEYRWDSHTYGSIVWTLTGFHSVHVLVLLLKTVMVEYLALRGYFNRERNLGVEVNGIYWHFVVAVWLPIYFVLYIVPRL